MVELEEIDQDVEKTMSGLLSYLIPNIDFLCSILYSKSVPSRLGNLSSSFHFTHK